MSSQVEQLQKYSSMPILIESLLREVECPLTFEVIFSLRSFLLSLQVVDPIPHSTLIFLAFNVMSSFIS